MGASVTKKNIWKTSQDELSVARGYFFFLWISRVISIVLVIEQDTEKLDGMTGLQKL